MSRAFLQSCAFTQSCMHNHPIPTFKITKQVYPIIARQSRDCTRGHLLHTGLQTQHYAVPSFPTFSFPPIILQKFKIINRTTESKQRKKTRKPLGREAVVCQLLLNPKSSSRIPILFFFFQSPPKVNCCFLTSYQSHTLNSGQICPVFFFSKSVESQFVDCIYCE